MKILCGSKHFLLDAWKKWFSMVFKTINDVDVKTSVLSEIVYLFFQGDCWLTSKVRTFEYRQGLTQVLITLSTNQTNLSNNRALMKLKQVLLTFRFVWRSLLMELLFYKKQTQNQCGICADWNRRQDARHLALIHCRNLRFGRRRVRTRPWRWTPEWKMEFWRTRERNREFSTIDWARIKSQRKTEET